MAGKSDRVFAILEEEIRSGKIPSGSRLPSFRELLKALTVSHYTLAKALSRLEKAGLIARREKFGIYARGIPIDRAADHASLQPRESKAEQLASELREEICKGEFRVGQFLPAPKVLQFRHKSSPLVVRNACKILEGRGLIRKTGRSYVVGPEQVPLPKAEKKVIVLTNEAIETSIASRTTTGDNVVRIFMRALGDTLSNLGIQMQRNTASPGEDLELPGKTVLENTCGVIGMFSAGALHLYDKELLGEFVDFVGRTNRRRIPFVAFRRTYFSTEFMKATRKYRQFFPISTAATRPGDDVGRHLALLGHKRIAFLNFSNEDWDRQRFEDTCRSHREIFGTESNISPFTAKHDNKSFFRKYTAEKPGPYFGEFVEKEHAGYSFQSIKPYWEAKSYVRDLLLRDRVHSIMPPFFEQALNMPSVTAWACADQLVAMSAIRFLRSKNIRVPEDVSLICCDDSNDLMLRGISAFSFQAEQLGYLAAHCIAGDIPVKRKRNGLVDCPGRIIERGSVGRA